MKWLVALLSLLILANAHAEVGDPQLSTDHPWYPGELAISTFERLAATQAAVYQRETGREVTTDEDKALASWYWRNLHYAHCQEGVGDYFTENSLLDFQVQVFLLRETDIPLVSDIIMPLFDPVSQMASVNLKGTLKKPEWRFAISPFNLFESKPDKIEEEPKEALKDFEFRR